MARWAGLEPATDGLENRCYIRLSYHRLKPVADGIGLSPLIDKGKARAVPLRHRQRLLLAESTTASRSATSGMPRPPVSSRKR